MNEILLTMLKTNLNEDSFWIENSIRVSTLKIRLAATLWSVVQYRDGISPRSAQQIY